ncbi:hypothetical protein TSH64_32055 [Azospirillum sp. TSH64]|nr:hypothetical protein TSH64_32055 [Azospirillum sp. TSH64]
MSCLPPRSEASTATEAACAALRPWRRRESTPLRVPWRIRWTPLTMPRPSARKLAIHSPIDRPAARNSTSPPPTAAAVATIGSGPNRLATPRNSTCPMLPPGRGASGSVEASVRPASAIATRNTPHSARTVRNSGLPSLRWAPSRQPQNIGTSAMTKAAQPSDWISRSAA